jgi:hypothetical protein
VWQSQAIEASDGLKLKTIKGFDVGEQFMSKGINATNNDQAVRKWGDTSNGTELDS